MDVGKNGGDFAKRSKESKKDEKIGRRKGLTSCKKGLNRQKMYEIGLKWAEKVVERELKAARIGKSG